MFNHNLNNNAHSTIDVNHNQTLIMDTDEEHKVLNSSNSSITALVPGGVVTTHNISTVIRPKGNSNSLQFVKIQTPELSKKAVEQIRIADETKISKEKIKEVEEEWQNNLLNWKSKRRQQLSHSVDYEPDKSSDNSNDCGARKVKTFAEMIEQRAKSGNRLSFHLQRYAATDDDEEEDDPVVKRDNEDEKNLSCSSSSSSDSDKQPPSLESPITQPLTATSWTSSSNVKKAPSPPMKPAASPLMNQTPSPSMKLIPSPPVKENPSTPMKQSPSALMNQTLCLHMKQGPPPQKQQAPHPPMKQAPSPHVTQISLETTLQKASPVKQNPIPVMRPCPPVEQNSSPTVQNFPLRITSISPRNAPNVSCGVASSTTPKIPSSISPRLAPSIIPKASPSTSPKLASPKPAPSVYPKVAPSIPATIPPEVAPSQKMQPKPNCEDKDNKTVLSISGKKRCSSCKEELGRGAAAFVVESLSLVYHTNCFRCSVCHMNLSNGFRGVDVRVHAGQLHCQNCYSKDGLSYSRV